MQKTLTSRWTSFLTFFVKLYIFAIFTGNGNRRVGNTIDNFNSAIKGRWQRLHRLTAAAKKKDRPIVNELVPMISSLPSGFWSNFCPRAKSTGEFRVRKAWRSPASITLEELQLIALYSNYRNIVSSRLLSMPLPSSKIFRQTTSLMTFCGPLTTRVNIFLFLFFNFLKPFVFTYLDELFCKKEMTAKNS